MYAAERCAHSGARRRKAAAHSWTLQSWLIIRWVFSLSPQSMIRRVTKHVSRTWTPPDSHWVGRLSWAPGVQSADNNSRHTAIIDTNHTIHRLIRSILKAWAFELLRQKLAPTYLWFFFFPLLSRAFQRSLRKADTSTAKALRTQWPRHRKNRVPRRTSSCSTLTTAPNASPIPCKNAYLSWRQPWPSLNHPSFRDWLLSCLRPLEKTSTWTRPKLHGLLLAFRKIFDPLPSFLFIIQLMNQNQ